MTKKIEITPLTFSHQTQHTVLELIEAMDKDVLILSIKENKQQITTSLTRADLLLLIEFFKLRGIS